MRIEVRVVHPLAPPFSLSPSLSLSLSVPSVLLFNCSPALFFFMKVACNVRT